MSGIEIDLDKLKIEKNGKVEYKMIKAFEDIRNDARNEGYKNGMNVGYKSAIEVSIKALMETMNLTLEQALDALKITDADRTEFFS